MKLNIEYEFLDHPYADEPGSKFDVWSKIRLEILDDNGHLVKTALDWQWDIIEFLNWLVENEKALRDESCPDNIKSPSIAKGLYDFYRKLNNNTDMAEIDKIFEYRERHGLRFALRGTDIDDVYIALNNGAVTISLHEKKERWNYNIDVEDFFGKIHRIYDEILPLPQSSRLAPRV